MKPFIHMLTQDDLNGMLAKAIEMVEALGIPVPESICPVVGIVDSHNFFGRCCGPTSNNNDSGFDYLVQVSRYTLKNTERSVMNTLIHEVLHACPGGRGHRGNWKKYADLFNSVYGYNIRRCGGDKTLSDKENLFEGVIRYVIECPSCGRRWYRQKASEFTRHPERWKCGSCKTNLRLSTGDESQLTLL